LKLLTFGKDLVASGGYLILATGDQVYCDASSIIGNISVIIPKYGLKGVLDLF
jgi:ClpP class serine protease